MNIETLKEIMLQKGLVQADIAKILGIKQQAVGQWFSRGRIPLKYHYMLKKHFGLHHPPNITKEENNIDVKKVLNIKVSAGTGYETSSIDEYDESETISVSRNILGSLRKADNIRAIKVDGKSMLPTLMPDEYVLIDITKNFYSGDGIYVLNYGGNLVVKRLQFLPINNGTLEIISDNKDFKSYKVVLNDDQTTLYIVGKVICQITK